MRTLLVSVGAFVAGWWACFLMGVFGSKAISWAEVLGRGEGIEDAPATVRS